MSYDIRPITADEVFAFRSAVTLGFGQDAKPDDDARFLSLLPLERTVAVFDGADIVGNLGDFPLQLTVPGGAQLAMAGMTMVGVRATHTRQGILRSMVNHYLDKAVERGEPVCGLWSSEPGIYGRFGFGLATESHYIKIDTRHLHMNPPSDSIQVSMIEADEIPTLVAPFWSRMATQRSGFLERSDARWQDLIRDPEHRREGGSASRHIVAKRDGNVVGYLAYRQMNKWDGFVADGSINVLGLVGEDIDAHRALWYYATNVDLFPNVSFWDAPTDDPLAYEVSNSRSVHRKLTDALYVRILDVTSALSARTYEADDDLVVEITDQLGYADGTFKVSVRGGAAEVSESTDSPDVSIGVRELSAMYLGRVCADLSARSGLITGDEQAIRRLGQLFATARAPWCPEMF